MPKVLLNSETAKQAGILSGQRRRERSLRSVQVPVQQALSELEKEFTQNTLAQLRRCDSLLSRCQDPKLFVQLTLAREKISGLIFPKPGTRKPKSLPVRPSLPVAMDDWHRGPLVTQEEEPALPVPEQNPSPPSPSSTAPVEPVPVPVAPELEPPQPNHPGGSPRYEPETSRLTNGSPPPMPPMVRELMGALSLLFKRPASQPWTCEETRPLLMVAQRRNAATELQLIVNCRRRLLLEKKSSFPLTALALLENWDKVLAYAIQHLPR